MKLWDLINSDISITVFSFVLGGVLVSWLSFSWQKRAQKHAVRLTFARELIGTYHDYIRFLRREEKINNEEEFDELHTEMLSKSYMANIVFDKALGQKIRALADKLQNCHQLRKQGRLAKAEQCRTENAKYAQEVIEQMYKLLNG